MPPNFTKKTIDTVARRAAFICSRPECRVHTVGPNTDDEKSTTIGEAAHIEGARPDSARYDSAMNDYSRAAITNALWLCRNCHKLIDHDSKIYPSELLFIWREEHESYVAKELGTSSDRVRFDIESSEADLFEGFPAVIRRIVIDKPETWEWRLTAELMRHLNKPVFRQLNDLRNGYYSKPGEHVQDDYLLEWINERMNEFPILIDPPAKLIGQLNSAWEKENAEEILHICQLLKDSLIRIVEQEERVHFAIFPEELERLHNLLKNTLGAQADHFSEIPDALDGVVALVGGNHGGTEENPTIVEKTIEFELPDNWVDDATRELEVARRYIMSKM